MSSQDLGVKRPGRGADKSPLCNAEAKNVSTRPCMPSQHVHGQLYLIYIAVVGTHTETLLSCLLWSLTNRNLRWSLPFVHVPE